MAKLSMIEYFRKKAEDAHAAGDNAARARWAKSLAAALAARDTALSNAKAARDAARFEFFASIGLTYDKGYGWSYAEAA
jgi:hypothetical protein